MSIIETILAIAATALVFGFLGVAGMRAWIKFQADLPVQKRRAVRDAMKWLADQKQPKDTEAQAAEAGRIADLDAQIKQLAEKL